jgi:predicted Kef-type K+ transport protein
MEKGTVEESYLPHGCQEEKRSNKNGSAPFENIPFKDTIPVIHFLSIGLTFHSSTISK